MGKADTAGIDLIPLADAAELWEEINSLPIAQLGNLVTLAGHLRNRGHLIIGRRLVRHGKTANKWRISESDLRTTAADLARLSAAGPERETVGRNGRTWRSMLARRLDSLEESPRFDTSEWGFLHLPEVCEIRGKVWTIPTAYVPFLTDGYRATARATRLARMCAECGRENAQNEIETVGGYVRLCRSCHAGKHRELREYRDEYRGVLYSTSGRSRTELGSALEYQCAACGVQAVAWDHCHDHGYIRGPLCGSCNRHDGVSRVSGRPALEHLWRCPTCRQDRSIPIMTRAKVIQRIGMLWSALLSDASRECHQKGFPLYNGVDQAAVVAALERRGPLVVTWQCGTCGKVSVRRLGATELAALDKRAIRLIRNGYATERLDMPPAREAWATGGPDTHDVG